MYRLNLSELIITIELIITTNYHLVGENVTNFNEIRSTVSEI